MCMSQTNMISIYKVALLPDIPTPATNQLLVSEGRLNGKVFYDVALEIYWRALQKRKIIIVGRAALSAPKPTRCIARLSKCQTHLICYEFSTTFPFSFVSVIQMADGFLKCELLLSVPQYFEPFKCSFSVFLNSGWQHTGFISLLKRPVLTHN